MSRTSVSNPQRSSEARDLLDQAKDLSQSNPNEARVLAQQARFVAHASGDQAAEAESFFRLACLAYCLDRTDEAFRLAVDARDLASTCGATDVEAWTLNLIAIVHCDAGNYAEALATSLHGLELMHGSEDRPAYPRSLHTLAIIHHSLGDRDRAIETYSQALEANSPHRQIELDTQILLNMASLRAERREFFHAVSLGESALEASRVGAPELEPVILANLGSAYANLGDEAQAEQYFSKALALVGMNSDSGVGLLNAEVGLIRALRGQVELDQGNYDRAEAEFMAVLALTGEAALTQMALDAHQALSTICRKSGRFEQALDHQEARFSINDSLFNRGADLRIKTLQIAHDTEYAQQQSQILKLRTTELENLVRQRIQQYEAYQVDAFQRLATLAELRDSDTSSHTHSVGDIAADIAHELQEPIQWCESLRLAARLHDIGKVATPDLILLKPGPLDADEFVVMMQHTTIGAQILAGSTSPVIQLAELVALSHHERWDGNGYPSGLVGADIPRCARIVSVADVYEALTSVQPYKSAWSPAEAVKYVIEERGCRFEPEVVDAFLRVIVRRVPELQFSTSVPIRQRHDS